MNGKTLIILFVVVIASFSAGFLVANSINRKEIGDLQSELATLKADQKENAGRSLTNAEIRSKIAEADSDPGNLEFQKNLGIALYKYASMKQDASYLDDISRILMRADDNAVVDTELLAILGNVFLDRAINKSENESFGVSRKYFERALKLKPDDLKIRSILGSTFLLQNPSDPEKAIIEFERSLAINKAFEPALEGLIQASLLQNNLSNTQSFLGKLKAINPNNNSIPGFESQLEKLKTK